MGDVFQPLEMLSPRGVQAKIKNPKFQYPAGRILFENYWLAIFFFKL